MTVPLIVTVVVGEMLPVMLAVMLEASRPDVGAAMVMVPDGALLPVRAT